MRRTVCTALGCVVSLFAFGTDAPAAIQLFTDPVPSLLTGELEASVEDAINHIHGPIYLIREQAVTLTDPLAVDGTPSDPMGLPGSPGVPAGSIAAGTAVQSWILHFDMNGSLRENNTAMGSYDFGLPILGLIFTEQGLDATDALLGNPGTIYPNGVYYRDSNDSEDPEDEWSVTGLTTLDVQALQNESVGLDQIRVITSQSPVVSTPEPSGIAIWLLITGTVALGSAGRRRWSK